MKEFVQNYLQLNFDYSLYSAQNEGRNLRVKLNRHVNNYKLFLPNGQDYSDYLLLNENGGLIEGSIVLTEFDMTNATSYPIITLPQLSNVVSLPEYPKLVTQFAPQGYKPSTTPTEGVVNYEPLESEKTSLVTSCDAQTIEVGYLYANTKYKSLAPVFKIGATGTVVLESKSYTVNLSILTNAIDPKFVYIPSDVEKYYKFN
jgi:hypothetical protein